MPNDGSERLLQGSATETTYCNTWCQLKNSLGLTIVGFAALMHKGQPTHCLFTCSPCLLWENEGRHVGELRRISFCKNEAVMRTSGGLFTLSVSVDDDAIEFHPGALNVMAPVPRALVIKRTCMIYQKFEVAQRQDWCRSQTATTTYTVMEDWTMTPQSKRLEHLTGETNSRGIWDELVSYSGTPESAAPATPMHNLPPNLPPQLMTMLQPVDMTKAPHALVISRAAHVSEFSLTKDAIVTEQATFQSAWLPLPAELIPYEIEPLPELRKDHHGNLTTVEEGNKPVNGYILIKFEDCPDRFDASFIVQQILAEFDPEAGTH
ncbi:LOW QUALITY PROTEIN: hypothetical protein ACHAXA_006824 [Cyclostephanos tholiformis]|uniref:Uncharacterized protein n=1 Tax=Cyclostephanos tholiformis TaxID=382380 RepID=A0ABD3R889_9STRA